MDPRHKAEDDSGGVFEESNSGSQNARRCAHALEDDESTSILFEVLAFTIWLTTRTTHLSSRCDVIDKPAQR